eukprot:2576349-Amphidinium_carterae.1
MGERFFQEEHWRECLRVAPPAKTGWKFMVESIGLLFTVSSISCAIRTILLKAVRTFSFHDLGNIRAVQRMT